jgi:sialic acid synthase SpsE
MLDEFVPAFKVASGDLNWYQFLEHLALKGKPILLSTGMAEVDEISRALETIRQASPLLPNESVVLLHCVSAYPAPVREVNLLSISYLREKFGVPVGYSDHTSGILVCETAAALGARVIEKHFTYRKEGQAFRDHALSADPAEMKELVARIRLIEASLGANDKKLMEIEKQNRVAMRRSLAAGKNLSRGETITGKMITFLRPGTGIPPEGLSSIIGRRAARDIAEGSIIEEKDIE